MNLNKKVNTNLYVKSLFLGFFLICNISLNAKSIDVMKFDIAGIKLGMSPDEVKKIIIDAYHPSKEELHIGFRYGERKKDEREEYIAEISYRKSKGQGFNIRVQFCLVPEEKNKKSSLLAEDIVYSIKGINENIQKVRKMAISKYGEPMKKSDYSYEWCEHIDSSLHTCALFEPKLSTYSASVRLTNAGYSKIAGEIKEKWKIVEPKF